MHTVTTGAGLPLQPLLMSQPFITLALSRTTTKPLHGMQAPPQILCMYEKHAAQLRMCHVSMKCQCGPARAAYCMRCLLVLRPLAAPTLAALTT